MSEDEEKVKLRRLEPAIQKFTKIVIPTDLERLRKHQINIEKVSICFHSRSRYLPGFLLAVSGFQLNRESETSNLLMQQDSLLKLVFMFYKCNSYIFLYYVEEGR